MALNGQRFFFVSIDVLPILTKRKQVNGKGFQNDGMPCCHSNETGSRDESPKRKENELHKADVTFVIIY